MRKLKYIKKAFGHLSNGGYKKLPKEEIPLDISGHDLAIIDQVRPYTMTGALRVESLLKSVRYCIEAEIEGAFVECGVWKGGSVLAMVLELISIGVTDRDIYLYDTFEGMTPPSEKDTSSYQESASSTWQKSLARGEKPWDYFFGEKTFSEAGVRTLLQKTGYPLERLHFVRGPVEETIPKTVPDNIALLRLDTDWYESTCHELEYLYPLLSRDGVLIVDDYGHWEGCRKAVDEYLAREEVKPLLMQRIDYTGRLAIKRS